MTEQEYNKSSFKTIIDAEIKLIGLNIKCWYFGEAVKESDYANVYFSCSTQPDYVLCVDLDYKNKKWIISQLQMLRD